MKKKLQVFVSSTFEDLKEERQAAVSTILEAGHIPAGMELFSATDQTQKVVIKKWIDESDVYMLILGGRYGSIDPESETSYTEWEYNYATEIKKPLFAVVIDDDALEAKVQKYGTDMMEKINPTLLTAFKNTVLGNVSSFFSDNNEIKLAIWRSISDIKERENLVGWVSGSEVPDDKELLIKSAKLEGKIENLTVENKQLQKKLEKQAKALTITNVDSGCDFEKLTMMLEGKELPLPKKKGEDTSVQIVALEYFTLFKNIWITGCRNSDSRTQYFYHNVCPTFKLHGLLDIHDKGSSGRWFELSKKGADFLVYLDEKAMIANKELVKDALVAG